MQSPSEDNVQVSLKAAPAALLPTGAAKLRLELNGGSRSLAGKPLAGFRATPDRRIIVLCGMIVSVIRLKNPLLHLQSSLRRLTLMLIFAGCQHYNWQGQYAYP